LSEAGICLFACRNIDWGERYVKYMEVAQQGFKPCADLAIREARTSWRKYIRVLGQMDLHMDGAAH
jgi:hypothetical protein